jgi:hypothetical protein
MMTLNDLPVFRNLMRLKKMLEHDVQQQINRLNGALEILGLLRERVELQLAEAADESAKEALNETLGYIGAIYSEYRRRQRELHPHHKTFLFYLTDAGVLPVGHDSYIQLVEGKSVDGEFSGQRIRLADWYVRLEGDIPEQAVNETYSWVVFNQQGRMELHAAQAVEASPLPTEQERAQIEKLLFTAR